MSKLMYTLTGEQLQLIRSALQSGKNGLQDLRDSALREKQLIMAKHWDGWVTECESAIQIAYFGAQPILVEEEKETSTQSLEEAIEKNPEEWEAV